MIEATVERAGTTVLAEGRGARAAECAIIRDALCRRQRELPSWLLERVGDDEHAPTDDGLGSFDGELALVDDVLPLLLDRDRPRTVADIATASPLVARRLEEHAWKAPSVAHFVRVRRHPVAQFSVESSPAAPRAQLIIANPVVEIPLSRTLPAPLLAILAGNAIGRLSTIDAIRTLRAVRGAARPGDRICLGVDTRTDWDGVERSLAIGAARRERRHAALLSLVSDRYGITMDPSRFHVRASIDVEGRRIETSLVARGACCLTFPDASEVTLRRGESIRTATSATFDRRMVNAMLAGVGLSLEEWYDGGTSGAAIATATVSTQGAAA